ncbi:hypothetical protein [Pseudonocardia acaciae]|uniref:hypothetical protein n=1 Tax=Pseudonocardia acaciae TaxID=551276 RepID=UPI0012EE9F5D|nr:hypothetical protein [Pseudonocardia acaciae]
MARVPRGPDILDTVPTPDPAHEQDDRPDLAALHDNLFDGERFDGIYRGCPGGIHLLAVTNRRLMVLDSSRREGRTALTSIPISQISTVSYLAPDHRSIPRSTTVEIQVRSTYFELCCQDEEQAHEVHDLLIWNLVGV